MVWCATCQRNVLKHRDDTTCMEFCSFCGKVLSQDVYAEEPTFVKGSGGESRLAGSYVNSMHSDYSESYRRTLEKGSSKIRELAFLLHMTENIKEKNSTITQAEGFYKIAVERSFTKGRRTDQVAAACLYIACRDSENKQPFLLIDFSSCLNINVYVLGAVFLQLCQLLSLQEHPIVQSPVDPSLFIGRFTSELLGLDNLMVSKTALNIIASMKRDWMQTGRKPSGLCGAAVYISALSHGVNCSKLDVVKAVHVCEATLTKRLIEFENTNSGSLTIEEFNKNAKMLEKEDHLSKLSDANSKNSHSVEVLCQHKDRKSHFAGLCESCCKHFIELSGGLHGGAEPPAFKRAEKERLAKASSEKVKDSSFILKPHQKKSSAEHINKMDAEHFTEANPNVTEAETAPPVSDQATVNDADDIFQKSNNINSIGDELESLSDIDDDEVKGYLNSEEECFYKKIIWEEMNKEYLQEQAAKEAAAAAAFKDSCGLSDDMRSAQELAAAARAAVAKSREERRQKRASEAKNANPAQTAAEATRQMLTKKRLSSKINYDVLEKLFDEPPAPDSKRPHIEGNEADAGNNNEQDQENEDMEETVGEEPYLDEWYSRNEEEAFDDGYYDNDGDDEY
ncbi:uncharacterized protein LOC130789994 isoform X1 [Actinidia eriantha]|uniref:uncharacterized protein LOC130789994 isoform X1 n=1 Tax=Actinidia eriantha TaxID=165200 RepID=UPI00258708A1|nr:uncharacterized protein LOC130789994 isoform X1 [Actinidia eriantha]